MLTTATMQKDFRGAICRRCVVEQRKKKAVAFLIPGTELSVPDISTQAHRDVNHGTRSMHIVK